ncbi:hypothetical protein [Shinella zoogloeoides]|uniref:hypothetical protein n=1 Tax=Shinella zoogloeoides TaxID=352475 RepID=UPI0013C322AA|nr:hypothetical protein [Shinella zoogloeoides]
MISYGRGEINWIEPQEDDSDGCANAKRDDRQRAKGRDRCHICSGNILVVEISKLQSHLVTGLQSGLSPDTLHPDVHSIFNYLDDIVRSRTYRLVEAVTVRTIHGSAIVRHRVDKQRPANVERPKHFIAV